MTISLHFPKPTGAIISRVNTYFKRNNYINEENRQIATDVMFGKLP